MNFDFLTSEQRLGVIAALGVGVVVASIWNDKREKRRRNTWKDIAEKHQLCCDPEDDWSGVIIHGKIEWRQLKMSRIFSSGGTRRNVTYVVAVDINGQLPEGFYCRANSV